MGRVGRFTRRQTFVAVLLAVALGFAIRWAVETPVYAYGSDHFQHLLIARSLAAGEGFSSGGSQHPDLSRPPLFPVLTAGFLLLTGNVELAAQILIVLASALVVVPLFVLARNTFGPRAAMAALPLGALSRLVASAGLMTEPLFLFLGLSAGAATWSAVRRPRYLAFFAAGVVAGASALARFEGVALIPILAAWAAIGSGRRPPRPGPRLARALALLAGALLLYGPYVAWVSSQTHRWNPTPGVQYLRDMREVSDRLALRSVEGPWVPWTERAQYLVSADRRHRVLETYFNDGILLEPDHSQLAGSEPPAPPAGSGSDPRRWMHLILRRFNIAVGNLSRLPYRLHSSDFLPLAPVALGLVGAISALRLRRTRRALLYLVTLAIAALSPVLSHIEARFLYLPFAVGLIVSAGGWGWIASRLSALRGRGAGIARIAVHVGIASLVASSAFHHHTGHDARYRRSWFRQQFAAHASRELPPGPILAVQMHVPYWAGRPYRAIPVGDADVLLDYARSQGAVGVFFDSTEDLRRRPHLRTLLEDPPPAGLLLVVVEPLPDNAGEVRLFEVVSEPGMVAAP
jgi:4-amino-4-deoxy-L-arabinose transferase-like glycosyltransferase